jgi:hypothetical protein
VFENGAKNIYGIEKFYLCGKIKGESILLSLLGYLNKDS